MPDSFPSARPSARPSGSSSVPAGPHRLRQWIRRSLTKSLPRRRFLTSGPGGCRSVALTFDDGPHPTYTPRILDILAARGARGTFFVIGERAAAHPDLIRRIVTEGHAIGHHTYRHDSLVTMSGHGLANDIRQTDAILREAAGIRSRLFRPPYGKVGARRMISLWLKGMCVALWNRDPRDYLRNSAQELREVLFAEPTREGDIVLFHDNHPYVGGVLNEYLSSLQEANLEPVPLTAWTGGSVMKRVRAAPLDALSPREERCHPREQSRREARNV